MPVTTCPTDVVDAPAEVIWELLVMPEKLGEWTETRLLSGPGRRLQAGDHVVYGAGPGLRATFDILAVEAPRTFGVDVTMSFGIVNHEVIQLSPMGADRCRVTFN